MSILEFILLSFLIICAVSVCLCKDTLTSIIIFMCYSLVMSAIWLIWPLRKLPLAQVSPRSCSL